MSKVKFLTLPLLFCFLAVTADAQKTKPGPKPTPATISTPTTTKELPFEPVISDFAFVADLGVDGQAKIRLQINDHSESIPGRDFNNIYRSIINGGVYEDLKKVRDIGPVIIIRPAPGIVYGDLVKFAEPLRTFGPNTIKVTVGDIEYVVIPAAIKEEEAWVVKPNPLTLIVNVDEKLNIYLNREPHGNISDPMPVAARLRQVFREREDNGVFRPDTYEIEKTVGIRLPADMPFEQAIKLVNAIRNAGSDQIAFIFEAELAFVEQVLPGFPDGIVDLPEPPKRPKKKRSRK